VHRSGDCLPDAGRRTGAGLPQRYASLSGSKPSRSAPENVRSAPAAVGEGHHKSAVVTLLQPPPNVRAAGWLSFVVGALFVGFADRQHYSLPILFAGAISALAIGLFHAAIGAIAARIGSECRSRLFPPEILEPIRRQCRIDHLTRR
jgi:hypothetical protein